MYSSRLHCLWLFDYFLIELGINNVIDNICHRVDVGPVLAKTGRQWSSTIPKSYIVRDDSKLFNTINPNHENDAEYGLFSVILTQRIGSRFTVSSYKSGMQNEFFFFMIRISCN